MPDLSTSVGTTRLGVFQEVILHGHEYPSTPGLVDVRLLLREGQLGSLCKRLATIIDNTFVNKIMEDPSRDAVQVTPAEVDEHDPQGLFLGHADAKITIMGSPISVPREEVGLTGDVMSALWKDDALALMRIIYGLGQECVDAAKEG